MSLVEFWFEFFSLDQKKKFFLLISVLEMSNIYWFGKFTVLTNFIKMIKGGYLQSTLTVTWRRFTKKSETRKRWCIPKKWFPLLKIFLYLFFLQLSFCSSVSRGAVILHWGTTTHPRGYIKSSKSLNSTILTTLFLNTYVFMCKGDLPNKLKLQKS